MNNKFFSAVGSGIKTAGKATWNFLEVVAEVEASRQKEINELNQAMDTYEQRLSEIGGTRRPATGFDLGRNRRLYDQPVSTRSYLVAWDSERKGHLESCRTGCYVNHCANCGDRTSFSSDVYCRTCKS